MTFYRIKSTIADSFLRKEYCVMEINLHGRMALITGASHGIGKAIAQEFVTSGACVALVARNYEKLCNAAQEINTEVWAEPILLCGDVTHENHVRNMFVTLEKEAGHLDILVNNVGGAEPFGDFFSLNDYDWVHTFDLNVLSMVRFSRRAIPLLRKSNCARIINISSFPAHQPGANNPHYIAAKAGMLALNKYLANVLGPDNILVNAICPATLKGGGWDQNVRDRATRDKISFEDAERRMEEEGKKKTPLGRLGTLEDVAKLATFLASSANNYITGSVFDVDGGIRRSVK